MEENVFFFTVQVLPLVAVVLFIFWLFVKKFLYLCGRVDKIYNMLQMLQTDVDCMKEQQKENNKLPEENP